MAQDRSKEEQAKEELDDHVKVLAFRCWLGQIADGGQCLMARWVSLLAGVVVISLAMLILTSVDQ